MRRRAWFQPLAVFSLLAVCIFTSGAFNYGTNNTANGTYTPYVNSPQSNSASIDFADPAGFQSQTGIGQLYATGDGVASPSNPNNNAYSNNEYVATESWNESANTYSGVSGPVTPVSGYQAGWAPTVNYIGGEYVMWYSGFHGSVSNGTNCLVPASSSSATGPFTVGATAVQLCYTSDPTVGLFDPSIYIAPNGTPWLTYCGEPTMPNNGTKNQCDSQQLASDGLSVLTSTPLYDVDDYNGISQIIPGQDYAHGVVENPDFVAQPSPYQDADGHTITMNEFVSYGVYNESNEYHTLEIPCSSIHSATQTNPFCSTVSFEVAPTLL